MSKELLFSALGGLGEIGMNSYLYGLDGRWLMVDLGVSFADDRLPGADLVLPDVGFIEDQKDKLDGLIITHAHEDHIGAVPYLWPRLGCPLYCTRFANAVLQRKLSENGVEAPAPIHVIEDDAPVSIGGFKVSFLHVTHSIPDANALLIETPHGKVMHSGDWKLDPAPIVGERTDVAGLERFGEGGVLALVADSTNVFSPGTSGSESEVRESLSKLVKEQTGRVAVTTFASNIARLETAMVAGRDAGREVVVVGRSMHRMLDAAREIGILKDTPPLLDERDAMALPPNKVMFLLTGSQGEPRAAMQRVATGGHPKIKLEAGDTAIFSSKIIPGNERSLYNLHNQLAERGIKVITEDDHFIHVSGHPSRDEMASLYRWLKPKIAVPMHGEARHLYAHAEFAKEQGVETSFVLRTGDILRLAPEPGVIGEFETGRMAVENPDEFLDSDDEIYRTRRRLGSHGTLFVAVALDPYGSLLAPPNLRTLGAVDLESFAGMREEIAAAVSDTIEDLDDRAVLEDRQVEHAVRGAVRSVIALPRYKRPLIEVQLIRLSSESLDALEDVKGAA